jgi:hypothetical protein
MGGALIAQEVAGLTAHQHLANSGNSSPCVEVSPVTSSLKASRARTPPAHGPAMLHSRFGTSGAGTRLANSHAAKSVPVRPVRRRDFSNPSSTATAMVILRNNRAP